MSVLITLIILSLIILVHEFGHFIAARKCGVLVEEFAMGMGPVLLSKKPGETVYSIRLFPIGGFCKMHGEDGEADDDKRAFCNKSIPRRVIILSAGALMNFILAIVVIFIVNLFGGMTVPVITSLVEGFPAEQAGLAVGDRIIKIGGTGINSYDEFSFTLADYEGVSFPITVKRDGKNITVWAQTKLLEDESRYILGIAPQHKAGILSEDNGGGKVGVFEALATGFFQVIFLTKATLIMLVRMITAGGLSLGSFTGIVGMTSMVGSAYTQTVTVSVWAVVETMATLLAFISANIGLVNLLPLPALDGGRLMFIFAEGIFKKRVNPEKEAIVHFVGLALLMVLAVVIAVNDYIVFF